MWREASPRCVCGQLGRVCVCIMEETEPIVPPVIANLSTFQTQLGLKVTLMFSLFSKLHVKIASLTSKQARSGDNDDDDDDEMVLCVEWLRPVLQSLTSRFVSLFLCVDFLFFQNLDLFWYVLA
jgi:hypothetical protein